MSDLSLYRRWARMFEVHHPSLSYILSIMPWLDIVRRGDFSYEFTILEDFPNWYHDVKCLMHAPLDSIFCTDDQQI